MLNSIFRRSSVPEKQEPGTLSWIIVFMCYIYGEGEAWSWQDGYLHSSGDRRYCCFGYIHWIPIQQRMSPMIRQNRNGMRLKTVIIGDGKYPGSGKAEYADSQVHFCQPGRILHGWIQPAYRRLPPWWIRETAVIVMLGISDLKDADGYISSLNGWLVKSIGETYKAHGLILCLLILWETVFSRIIRNREI